MISWLTPGCRVAFATKKYLILRIIQEKRFSVFFLNTTPKEMIDSKVYIKYEHFCGKVGETWKILTLLLNEQTKILMKAIIKLFEYFNKVLFGHSSCFMVTPLMFKLFLNNHLMTLNHNDKTKLKWLITNTYFLCNVSDVLWYIGGGVCLCEDISGPYIKINVLC